MAAHELAEADPTSRRAARGRRRARPRGPGHTSRSSSTARPTPTTTGSPTTSCSTPGVEGRQGAVLLPRGRVLRLRIRLIEGEVSMIHNDVLDAEDLDEGIRLGCQSLPVTDVVRVTYH